MRKVGSLVVALNIALIEYFSIFLNQDAFTGDATQMFLLKMRTNTVKSTEICFIFRSSGVFLSAPADICSCFNRMLT